MARYDNRENDELRKHKLECDFVRTADGSCLVSTGATRVICTASVDESVPPFLKGTGKGWITAEYAMLPASTGRRKKRDGDKRDGRSVEIQRLIGRSLRQAVDMSMLGERCVYIDCDVLEADGGTRTASITGAYCALVCAIDKLIAQGKLYQSPIIGQVAAVSAGVVDDTPMLDLCYREDSGAQVDLNVVMNDKGEFIEVQGTGEGRSYTRKELDRLLEIGEKGAKELMAAQREALGEREKWIAPKQRLIVMSGNSHKVYEMKRMLEGLYDVLSIKDLGIDMDVEETGETFEENAILKAEALMKFTGCPSIADDSGLMVDALGGAPGVYSARYCGVHGEDEKNNDLLLENLKNVPNPRNARFVSAIALARPDKETLCVRGVCEGTITNERRGNNGFGYDPLFLYKDKTFAEMGDEKLKISHRAKAMQALMEALEKEKA
ncbi:MAG: ribonuclease PH [Eubacteriales bacterium]|nr:ribonuclease PH [Eubacteriales bacterium]MDD3882739.1 ribonuclease PH [Eubacteriales bacterium]MDD4512640.1 ribonuclease PH [Eubacteriales bacterium]